MPELYSNLPVLMLNSSLFIETESTDDAYVFHVMITKDARQAEASAFSKPAIKKGRRRANS